MKLRLDPRTKLFLLLLSNMTLFFHVNLITEVILVSILLSLFFFSGRYKSGIRMTLIYGFMVSAEFLIIPYTEGVFLNFIAMFSVGIRMMLPCVISGAYAFSTTTVGEMVCGLRKIKVPECIIVPSVTIIRFFPWDITDFLWAARMMNFPGEGTMKTR